MKTIISVKIKSVPSKLHGATAHNNTWCYSPQQYTLKLHCHKDLKLLICYETNTEMGWACGTYGGEEVCAQGFGEEA
jgi:hypothetical protein